MDITETRRINLRRWVAQNGTPPKEKSLFSQLKANGSFGERVARRLETQYKMGDGYLDALPSEQQTAITSEGVEARINDARASAISSSDPRYQPVAPTEEDGDEDNVRIPIVELKLSAGVSGFELDQDSEAHIGSVRLDHRFILNGKYDPSKLYALRIRGDSMESKLSDGDTVIINTGDTKLVDGVVYAVNYEGEAVIKRLSRDAGDWWLTSDNPDQRKYHRKVCRGSGCIIVGRAIQAITKL